MCTLPKSYYIFKNKAPKNIRDLSTLIRSKDLQAIYPYVDIALRMILCTPATNCSSERSFSTLRRLKTYLRSVMNNDRLNTLTVLNIESELTSSINYDNIIKEFAESQSRKKNLMTQLEEVCIKQERDTFTSFKKLFKDFWATPQHRCLCSVQIQFEPTYYCENIQAVRHIIGLLEQEDAISIQKAKKCLDKPNLENNLAYIKSNFSILSVAIDKLQAKNLSLATSLNIIKDIEETLKTLNGEPYHPIYIKLKNVLEKNSGLSKLKHISNILDGDENTNIGELLGELTCSDIVYFKYAPIVSVDVERSFSTYKTLLADNRRKFKFDNLAKHLIIQCNTQEHLKQKYPTLTAIPSTSNDPDTDLQNIDSLDNLSNVQLPSTSLNVQNHSLTSAQSGIPAKRSRQLKLFGSTQNNELTIAVKNDIDKSLVKMITADYQPLSIVENVGFLEYTKKLQPLYTPPSRKLLTTKLLPGQYNIIFSKLKYMLKNVNDVSVTTDMWTSDSTVLFDVTVVSDSGSNIKNAINEHLKKYHHPCVAHTLNLSVNEAINKNTEFLQVLKTCRAIVENFKHSSFARNKLQEFQKQMGLPELKVKQDVNTRWNSSLIMIERLIKIKDPLSAAISSLRRAPNGLTAIEWDIIADCVKILKPFESMTLELSGEKYQTLSLVIPQKRGLQFMVKNIKPETDAGILLQNSLLDIVARRLGILEKNKTVVKSTFLDPRFKKAAFGLADNAENTQKWIIEELTSIICLNNTDYNNITETLAPATLTESSNSL
ncbi:hypothetical protein QTP88_026934 [Uroleucon formosanum]